MDIKRIIQTFSKAQHDIEETISHLKPVYQNEIQLWSKLENLSIPVLINERIISFLADSMQLVANEQHLELFDLHDIKSIYQLLVKYYPYNIQYQLDLIFFVYNVLDEETEALELVNNAVKLIDQKRIILAEVLDNLKNDSE